VKTLRASRLVRGLLPPVHDMSSRALILTAGSVITMTDTPVSAVVIKDSTIAFAGTRENAIRRFPRCEIIDYGPKAAILPGFHDAHSHPEIVAENSLYVSLSAMDSDDRTVLAQRLTARSNQVGPGEWVRAVGFRPGQGRQQSVIDAHFLDQVCPRNPVYITHASSHWGVANSEAMALLGIPVESAPTGAIYEKPHFDAVFPALAEGQPRCPRAPEAAIAANLRGLLRQYASLGITSTVDALAWPGSYALYQQLAQEEGLPVRVGLLIAHQHLKSIAGFADRSDNDLLRVIGVKLFADGALSGGTCLVDKPYSDTQDYNGDEVLGEDSLASAIEEVLDAGHSPAIHANGDLAVHRVLGAFERHRDRARELGARLRIEHCSMVRQADLPRMQSLGVIPVLFGTFIGVHGDLLLSLYGPERAERIIAARSLLDAGLVVAASSDSPAAPVAPLQGIQDLVTRRTSSGHEFARRQSISVTEAIGLYTVGAAHAAGEHHRIGRIQSGLEADLVVLADDPRAVSSESISDVEVIATWMAGQQTWSADNGT
jgi:predicted amidohydrolase YtcJ